MYDEKRRKSLYTHVKHHMLRLGFKKKNVKKNITLFWMLKPPLYMRYEKENVSEYLSHVTPRLSDFKIYLYIIYIIYIRVKHIIYVETQYKKTCQDLYDERSKISFIHFQSTKSCRDVQPTSGLQSSRHEMYRTFLRRRGFFFILSICTSFSC